MWVSVWGMCLGVWGCLFAMCLACLFASVCVGVCVGGLSAWGVCGRVSVLGVCGGVLWVCMCGMWGRRWMVSMMMTYRSARSDATWWSNTGLAFPHCVNAITTTKTSSNFLMFGQRKRDERKRRRAELIGFTVHTLVHKAVTSWAWLDAPFKVLCCYLYLTMRDSTTRFRNPSNRWSDCIFRSIFVLYARKDEGSRQK